MPTVTIESDILDEQVRRRYVKFLSLHMGRIGIDLRRIVVKWHHLARRDLFAGPVHLPQIDGNAGNFAFVTLEIDKARDRNWRASLMGAVRQASHGMVGAERLFIRVIPVDPHDYWNVSLESPTHHPAMLES